MIQLENIFSPYGQIVDTLWKESYAFIEFETVQQAQQALKELNGSLVNNSNLVIQESKPKVHNENVKKEQTTRLYIGRIRGIDQSELKKQFAKFGDILDLKIGNQGEYCFIQYDNWIQAENAIKNLDRQQIQGKTISVQASKPRKDGIPHNQAVKKDKNRLKPNKFLRIQGLQENQQYDDLYFILKKQFLFIESENFLFQFNEIGLFLKTSVLKLIEPSEAQRIKSYIEQKFNKEENKLQVYPCSQQEFIYTQINLVEDDPRLIKDQKSLMHASYIIVSNLPTKCQKTDIQNFFIGFYISDIMQQFIYHISHQYIKNNFIFYQSRFIQNKQEDSDSAFIIFKNFESAIHSLHWNNKKMNNFPIKIQIANRKLFNYYQKNEFQKESIILLEQQQLLNLQQLIQSNITEKNQQKSRSQSINSNLSNSRSRSRSKSNSRSISCEQNKFNCYKCGEKGHKSYNCKFKSKKSRNTQGMRANMNDQDRHFNQNLKYNKQHIRNVNTYRRRNEIIYYNYNENHENHYKNNRQGDTSVNQQNIQQVPINQLYQDQNIQANQGHNSNQMYQQPYQKPYFFPQNVQQQQHQIYQQAQQNTQNDYEMNKKNNYIQRQ
ncbi:hypothetical protein PPERSA_06873 [Pseudocohnilembus persalinus]|uniref:Zinc finger, CCHC-type n=1 Tax=Pseudocohnilembus persalinus TaxID=266149 RepID=A0A0V0QSS9_PSEPJ|nr:hypothetical protein PPERSA_06873 [Pseudocohnilembus persalinus]|eukprot:KRX05239.1 hypothetical protein PPERSA_06873 [Pseudocohnilembus persalinus]